MDACPAPGAAKYCPFPRGLLTVFALGASLWKPAARADDGTPSDNPAPAFSPQVWLNTGFLSYHFNHAAHYNAYNWGVGADFRLGEDFTLSAGEYRNSMRYHSTYAILAWQPLHLGPLRIGALAGAVRGYPDVDHGGWAPMAAPVISVE